MITLSKMYKEPRKLYVHPARKAVFVYAHTQGRCQEFPQEELHALPDQ
jgi:hypothetical protein